jgi:spermidine synthase
MDFIIDDGLHTFDANVSFLDASLEHLRPGGIYVVEDILNEAIANWQSRWETVYSKQFPNHEFALVELPNSFNIWDNNLLIVRRHI